MHIAWVTNDVWFSRLLRWIFKQKTSHVGLIFRLKEVELALDINNPYGSLWSLNYWLHKYRLIYTLEIPLTKEEEFFVFKSLEEIAVLKPYDIKAYYYGMWRGLLKRLFKIPYPEVNKAVTNGKDMCQEIISYVLHHPIVQEKIGKHECDFTVMTPDSSMMYMRLITNNIPSFIWRNYEN